MGGQVEIVSNVKLITKDEKVSRSAAELLVMLNIKPFYYGIKVAYVYSNGEVFPADVLDISPRSRRSLLIPPLSLLLRPPPRELTMVRLPLLLKKKRRKKKSPPLPQAECSVVRPPLMTMMTLMKIRVKSLCRVVLFLFCTRVSYVFRPFSPK